MSTPIAAPSASARIASVDAYRGGVMFLMMAEALELGRMARSFPQSPAWQWLAHHQSHVDWRGCSIHDMIQPSFSFLVGVALPFSLASRISRGESVRFAVSHAAWRSLILVARGVFLRSVGSRRTNFTFEDTLSQIGLGYLPLFLIGLGPIRARWIALGLILVGFWGAFALYSGPGPNFDYASVGVPADWPHHADGLAAHWNKNGNLAWAFDRWFLNLFPRAKAFSHNEGGYSTLSFIPTLATMLLGLIAGGWLREDRGAWNKIGRMMAAGVVAVGAGLALDRFGICPIVKRIWTPSWVLFSGGVCLVTLALLYALIDLFGSRRWTFPFLVIGRNSIAAYCLAHLTGDFITGTFRTHLGSEAFQLFGERYEPLVEGASLLATYWLILFWMDRRRIYLKV